jgi:hypothetical protein
MSLKKRDLNLIRIPDFGNFFKKNILKYLLVHLDNNQELLMPDLQGGGD